MYYKLPMKYLNLNFFFEKKKKKNPRLFNFVIKLYVFTLKNSQFARNDNNLKINNFLFTFLNAQFTAELIFNRFEFAFLPLRWTNEIENRMKNGEIKEQNDFFLL